MTQDAKTLADWLLTEMRSAQRMSGRYQLGSKDREVWSAKAEMFRDAANALSALRDGEATEGASKWLGELLAIIHRDGGQYQALHGDEKAVADAHAILAAALTRNVGPVVASEAVDEIWDNATNAVCQTMQERGMCNCPDGDCLAAKVRPEPADYALPATPPVAPTGTVGTAWPNPPEAWELEAAAIFMDHVDDDETESVHRVAAFLRAVAALSAPTVEGEAL